MMGMTTDLSRDDLHVLDVAEDLWTSTSLESKEELCRWAITGLRNYLAAGCDPKAFADRIHELLNLLEEHLRYTRDSFKLEVAGFPKTAAERSEDLAGARAAQGLIERMREAR